jgi:hypothetical protein
VFVDRAEYDTYGGGGGGGGGGGPPDISPKSCGFIVATDRLRALLRACFSASVPESIASVSTLIAPEDESLLRAFFGGGGGTLQQKEITRRYSKANEL